MTSFSIDFAYCGFPGPVCAMVVSGLELAANAFDSIGQRLMKWPPTISDLPAAWMRPFGGMSLLPNQTPRPCSMVSAIFIAVCSRRDLVG